MILLQENPLLYLKKIVVFGRMFGGGGRRPPQVDYAALQRQQDVERKRLQGIRDEEFRISGVRDFINFQFDNPFQVTERAETGRFFKAISPGRIPGEGLKDYINDKTITAKLLKENTDKSSLVREPTNQQLLAFLVLVMMRQRKHC